MHDPEILARIHKERRERTIKIGFRTFKTRKLDAERAAVVKAMIATMIGDTAFAKLLELGAKSMRKGGAGFAAEILTMPEIVTAIAAAFGKVLQKGDTADRLFTTLFNRTRCDYAIERDESTGKETVCEDFDHLGSLWKWTLTEAGELERVAWWVLGENFEIASLVAGLSSGSTSAKAGEAVESSEPGPPTSRSTSGEPAATPAN